MNTTNNLSGTVNSQGSLKRKFSDDEDERRQDRKKAKRSWFVTLESESSNLTEEENESTYSLQGYETELAHDTSDTSTHSWISSRKSDISVHIEYELDSRSENENTIVTKSSSSEPESILEVEVIAFCESEGLADNSDDSRSSTDTEIKKADFRICVQCNKANNNPLFRYCEKCYQVKKMHYPRNRPRRKPRLHQKEQNEKTASVASDQELCQMDSGIVSSHIDLDSGLALAQDLDKLHSGSRNSIIQEDNVGLNLTIDKASSSKTRPDSSNNAEKFQSGTVTNTIQKTEIVSKQQTQGPDGLCNMCIERPKNGAFVHGRTQHICCCYRCAHKIWTTNGGRCPICNRKVTQVLKAFYD